MKLGYSYRLSQYAFGLGLLALLLAGGFVFFLNLITLRTEHYQTQLSSRMTRSSQSEPNETSETQSVPGIPPSSTPEYSPPPDARQMAKRAATQTVQMLRPLAFYLALTGATWVLLRGSHAPRPQGKA